MYARTTARRDATMLGGVLLVVLSLAGAAPALTLYQLSGSGDIEIRVDGSIHLDPGGGSFDQITLSASSASIGGSAPDPDAVVSLSGLDGYGAEFTGDVALEVVSWSGGHLSVTATGAIHTVGLEVPTIPLEPCGDGAGGVISTGDPVTGDDCSTDLEPIEGGATIIAIDLPRLELAVPEPGAAWLFAAGLLIVRARVRR